jgi:hypothetical protein
LSSPQILALWVSQPVLQAAIAIVVYRRKLYKPFPAFFWYTVAQVIFFAIQFPLHLRDERFAYFYAYWSAVAVNVVLEFKIIHEIFIDVFRPYPALKDLASSLFKWAAVVMILVSVVMISVSPAWNDPVAKTILVVQRGVRVVQCGLVVFLLGFCKHLKVSWRQQSFGIALGFGAFSATELFVLALFSGSHVHGQIVDTINLSVYSFAMVLWLAYSLLNSHESMLPGLVPQRWDEALTDIQPQEQQGDSLIPMFEHMVDRALSKVHDHV